MIQYRNGWFNATDLGNIAEEMRKTAAAEPGKWIGQPDTIDCKYIEIRVDMRSGDFCLKNAFGDMLTLTQIQLMFPNIEVEQYGEQ